MVLPDPLPSGWSLPEWVDSTAGPVCVVLDVSALRVTPETPAPEPAPSISPEQLQKAVAAGMEKALADSIEAPAEPDPNVEALLSEVQGFRALVLYSAGLLIFSTGALFFRSRRA